jgi:hypothetical protein
MDVHIFTCSLGRTSDCPVCFGDVMIENQSEDSDIQGPASPANEAAARSWFLIFFLTPASGYIIMDGGPIIITSEMARN